MEFWRQTDGPSERKQSFAKRFCVYMRGDKGMGSDVDRYCLAPGCKAEGDQTITILRELCQRWNQSRQLKFCIECSVLLVASAELVV